MGIHDQNRRPCRMGPLHGIVQGILNDKLHLAVNGQIDRGHHGLFFRLFRVGIFIGNDPAHGIGLKGLPGLCPFQDAVQGQFQAGQAAVVRSYKAQHLGRHGFFRIIPFTFGNKMQACQFMILNDLNDLFIVFGFQHALDPYKLAFQRKIFI